VIAKEPVEIYPYGLSCDLRINEIYGVYALAPSATHREELEDSAPGSERVDWYLGMPILSSRLELEAAIDRAHAAGQSVYIIHTRPDPNGPAVHLPKDVLEFLGAHQDQIAHTGDDGLTVVLRLPPS
jgi:hypothetical protein